MINTLQRYQSHEKQDWRTITDCTVPRKKQLNLTWDIEWDFKPRKEGHSGKTGDI